MNSLTYTPNPSSNFRLSQGVVDLDYGKFVSSAARADSTPVSLAFLPTRVYPSSASPPTCSKRDVIVASGGKSIPLPCFMHAFQLVSYIHHVLYI